MNHYLLSPEKCQLVELHRFSTHVSTYFSL
jgi:hypothetical protein